VLHVHAALLSTRCYSSSPFRDDYAEIYPSIQLASNCFYHSVAIRCIIIVDYTRAYSLSLSDIYVYRVLTYRNSRYRLALPVTRSRLKRVSRDLYLLFTYKSTRYASSYSFTFVSLRLKSRNKSRTGECGIMRKDEYSRRRVSPWKMIYRIDDGIGWCEMGNVLIAWTLEIAVETRDGWPTPFSFVFSFAKFPILYRLPFAVRIRTCDFHPTTLCR